MTICELNSVMMKFEQRYEKLVNYLTDYVYTVRIFNGVPVDTIHGPGCFSVTGYTPDEFKTDPDLWFKMVHRKDRAKVLEQARMALSGIEGDPIEHRIMHKNGTVKWIRSKIALTKNGDGSVIEYDGLINDITNLKKAEAAAALRTKQLIQADKLASLGILVSGIAHEINNPNNFILLNIQLLSKIWKDVTPVLDEYYAASGDFSVAGMRYSSAREKVAQMLDGVLKGSERIKNITSNLTEYARTDSNMLNEHVDVNRVVEVAVLIAGNLIKKSTDNFKVEYGKNLPLIRGNAQQIEQVVINLINNACQSLRDRSSEIRISTYFNSQRKKVRIKVEDQGVGIKPDDLKHIMDPFFTTKRELGGTGLGLSVSLNIVKSHGGTLILTSKPGQGTSARASFPLAQGETIQEAA